jgi:hypothetical protein
VCLLQLDVELRVGSNERGQDKDHLVQLVIQVSLPMPTNNILYVHIYLCIEREREREREIEIDSRVHIVIYVTCFTCCDDHTVIG